MPAMIQRRRFLQAAGTGAILGLAGCTGGDENQGQNGSGNGSGGGANGTQAQQGRSGIGRGGNLTLATTTSTYDTGLLDELNPMFQQAYGAKVEAISQGTGAAIETGSNGDADVILVHARDAEDEFLREYGVNRRDVMFNDFVVVGPPNDPAGVSGTQSATEAFGTIAKQQATFLSRGDDSGTNTKELSIWEEAGVQPSGQWYQETGQGMGDTLNQASQRGAYTLADRGTFLSQKSELELEIAVQGPLKDGPMILLNPYGVIPVDPAIHPNVNYQLAMAYAGFLTSPQGQSAIENYTVEGSQLFLPNALAEDPNFGQYVPQDYSAPGAGSLSRREKQYHYWAENLVPKDH
ncbi:molybdenum transporter [Halobacteriales archaeon QS_3_64_16]|nr:MAG: molybdenum transporter [Halobacteriales archaeon QS_3_64_16]